MTSQPESQANFDKTVEFMAVHSQDKKGRNLAQESLFRSLSDIKNDENISRLSSGHKAIDDIKDFHSRVVD
jgi:hypothetical protein